MAKDGLITRKDLIEEEALRLGADYAKNMQQAIEANKLFVGSLKEMAPLMNAFRNLSNQKDFIALKERESVVIKDVTTKWKEQDQAEKSLISTKRKIELATEGTNRQLIKERALLNETNAEIKKQAIASGLLESAYKKLSAQVGIAGDKVKNIIATGKLATESQAQYNKRLQQAQLEFTKLNSRVRSADQAVGQFNRNVGNYPMQAVNGIKSLISAFGVTTGIYLFATIMKDVVKISRDFEKQNATLSAVLQVEKEDMKELRDQAKKLGETTVKTAGEVTELQVAYARLGFSQQQILDMTESTIQGSIAMNSNLAETAELVGAVVNSFDDFSSTSAPEIIDIMSLATAKSALNFEKLQTAIPIAAGAANAVGIPFTRLVALFGKLSDAGIDASSSATALRNIFIESAAQNLNYSQVIEKIKNSTDKLTAANDEFGKRGAVSASIISANIDKVEELDVALQSAAGTSESMANKELATLDGAIKLLSSAWQGYVLDADDASGSNTTLTEGLKFVANNLKTILNVIGYATLAWIAYKSSLLLANVQTKLLAITTAQATSAQAANVVVTGIGTTAQTANATATTIATTAWERFNLVLKANALALIVVALAAAVYYLNKFNVSLSETVKETKKSTDEFLKSREIIYKNTTSVKILSDRYDELKTKTKLSAEEQKELQTIIESLSKTVPDAVTAVNKYGDAIAINTVKTREFTKIQRELNELNRQIEINKNIKDLQALKDVQKDLNRINKEGYGIQIDGIGLVVKEKGRLRVEELLGTRDLTIEEQSLFKTRVLSNEASISNTEANIKALKGLTNEEKELIKVKEQSINTDKKVVPVRTIEVIDSEIAAQNELIKTLSDKTGKQGELIKTKIKNLEAEKAMIYSTDKADKKATTDYLKRIKDVKDAVYNLSQFRYENAINLDQKIIDSDKATTDAKIDSLNNLEQLRQSKNQETFEKEIVNNLLSKEGLDKLSKAKLEAYTRDAENRAKSIVDGGISIDKLTTQETLIYEKYYANLKDQQEKSNENRQKIIDSEVDVLQKNIDKEVLDQNTKNQELLQIEDATFKTEIQLAEDNYLLLEKAKQDHEKRLLKITNDAKRDQLDTEIKAIQSLLNAEKKRTDGSAISIDKIKKLENELANYKTQLGEIGLDTDLLNAEKRVDLERDKNERLIDLGFALKESLTDLTNSIFDARISNIDNEISKNNEYYSKQIELAGNDARQKELLEKERIKKDDELQKKKKKEEIKAAIFAKAMAVITIGIQTAMASVAALAPPPIGLGPVAGLTLLPYIISLGAIQAATVLATPLPKYKMGRKGGPAELAVTGDGGVSEVISRPDGSGAKYTPNKPTLTYLQKDDIVHKSVADYNEYMRRSLLKGFHKERDQAKNFQGSSNSSYNDNSALIAEMKLTRDTIRKQKTNVNVTNKLDLGHELWRLGNIKWSK